MLLWTSFMIEIKNISDWDDLFPGDTIQLFSKFNISTSLYCRLLEESVEGLFVQVYPGLVIHGDEFA